MEAVDGLGQGADEGLLHGRPHDEQFVRTLRACLCHIAQVVELVQLQVLHTRIARVIAHHMFRAIVVLGDLQFGRGGDIRSGLDAHRLAADVLQFPGFGIHNGLSIHLPHQQVSGIGGQLETLPIQLVALGIQAQSFGGRIERGGNVALLQRYDTQPMVGVRVIRHDVHGLVEPFTGGGPFAALQELRCDVVGRKVVLGVGVQRCMVVAQGRIDIVLVPRPDVAHHGKRVLVLRVPAQGVYQVVDGGIGLPHLGAHLPQHAVVLGVDRVLGHELGQHLPSFGKAPFLAQRHRIPEEFFAADDAFRIHLQHHLIPLQQHFRRHTAHGVIAAHGGQ